MKTIPFGATALAAAALTACVAAAAATPDDEAFVRKAAAAGMDEVASGRVALKNAQDAKVKAFAERMVGDHTHADAQLKQIAAEEKIPIPDKLDKHAEKDLGKLTKLHGHAFDVAYAKSNVSAHEKAVKEFQKEAKTSHDERLRKFAADTEPVLEEHLKMAKDAAQAVGAKPGAS